MIKTIINTEEVIDFAWELSQTDLYASYPRRTSMKSIKEVIERAISSKNRNIVVCYQKDVLYGVCIYNWEYAEMYAQTEMLLIKEDYEKISEELISYISGQLPGYELLIGVPIGNNNANEYFRKKNIECISSSIVTRLYNLEPPTNKKNDKVKKITESDFEKYAIFHDKFAVPLEMYYDSKNLLEDIDRFRIFVFKEGEEIYGSILIKILKDSCFEVFGLFVDEEYEYKDINTILISETFMRLYNEFGDIKEIVYFIEEDCTEELNVALAAGFEIKDKYRCYKYIL